MKKIVVLDRRTSNNQSITHGDFCKCMNCGRTMLLDIGTDVCPECEQEMLSWVDDNHQEISEDFFYNNKEYILCDTED